MEREEINEESGITVVEFCVVMPPKIVDKVIIVEVEGVNDIMVL